MHKYAWKTIPFRISKACEARVFVQGNKSLLLIGNNELRSTLNKSLKPMKTSTIIKLPCPALLSTQSCL